MISLSRISIVITLMILGGCAGGGSSSGTVSDINDTQEATEVTIEEESEQETSNIGTADSTDGIFCDYDDTTFNSQESLTYTSTSRWTCTGTTRELTANGIPDHDVGTFPNANNPNIISEQTVSASYTLEPADSTLASVLGGPRGATGYVLNGVKIDASTAGTCDD